ncbi:lytic transglycosylase domain-containing protein [Comamonas piscis]|uniref:Lytic transglycosylase domain-containing protein n=1 Tax=Comamonas piscis TaxID=1562974 RepID=A0A7G5EJY0_9BURK|nr:lytic transglycosylase domain-containing protein [Comamonas piscis]QMV74305.1 lytic transglycosylase domain-containing protein [Comamonas piscis]WSO32751.1 lytic transglycosylase domain-containing protein [Comamonas piscis]
MTAPAQVDAGVRSLGATISRGLMTVAHNSFALIGLIVAFCALTLVSRPDLRHAGEAQLRSWLQARTHAAPAHELAGTEADALAGDDATMIAAVDRATASNPQQLPRNQAAVAYWLAKKYRVAPEPLAVLVSEAYLVGKETKLDPTLILAIMAVESSFNPFAQSSVGAQGLMQVMTKIHTDKYENFGGHFAAFDPVTNLRVGVKVLQECIQRAGSLEGGLKYYVGAANLPTDGGYAAKVMAEHFRIKQVADGRGNAPKAPAAKPSLSAQADTPANAETVVDKAKAPSNSATPGTKAETVALADKQTAVPAAAKAEATTVAMGS